MRATEFARLHKRAFEPQARAWREAEFERFLEDPNVIWAGDRRAFALARIGRDEAEVLTLACDPDHRRKGLASACLLALMEQASRSGVRWVFLDVAADNRPALGLYAKMGFGEVGRRAGYYRRGSATPVDALVLRKPVGPRV